MASVGTLVTDGHTVYALTSRHVAGPAGHPVSTILGGHRSRSGGPAASSSPACRSPTSTPTSRPPHLSSPWTPGWSRSPTCHWTSQTYGLPPVGELADLSERNIGTRLINAEVVAFGAASGQLRGRIAALFFRHRSIGGYDDITDFLIAPGPGQPGRSPATPAPSGTCARPATAAAAADRPAMGRPGRSSAAAGTGPSTSRSPRA